MISPSVTRDNPLLALMFYRDHCRHEIGGFVRITEITRDGDRTIISFDDQNLKDDDKRRIITVRDLDSLLLVASERAYNNHQKQAEAEKR